MITWTHVWTALLFQSTVFAESIVIDKEEYLKLPNYKDGYLDVKLTEEQGRDLYLHWAEQGFASLIAAMAQKRLETMEEYEKTAHVKCVKTADTVEKHATCVNKVIDQDLESRVRRRKNLFKQKKVHRRRKVTKVDDSSVWQGGFRLARAKREVLSRSSYQLYTKEDRAPATQLADNLLSLVRSFKNKDEKKTWKQVISGLKEKAGSIKRKKKVEKILKKKMKTLQDAAMQMFDKNKRQKVKRRSNFVQKEMELIDNLVDDEETRQELKEKLEESDGKTDTDRIPIKLVREGVKLGMALAGANTTDAETNDIKVISPRFMGLQLDDEQYLKKKNRSEINLLSPSLFALENEKQATEVEKKLSLPGLLSSFGKGASDKLMDLIVEATAVEEIVHDALDNSDTSMFKDKRRTPDGFPMLMNKENVSAIAGHEEAKKLEMIELLQTTLSEEQIKYMNRSGYAVLTPAQRRLVYGEASPIKNLTYLNMIENLSDAQIHRAVKTTIGEIAEGKTKFEVRQKDVVLSPVTLVALISNPAVASQAYILSPITLTYLLFSPCIYGSIIISPWTFVPIIISPRLLSPVILSPFLFSPLVLSPLALDPVILSPGVGNPFTLTPMVLCPFILSPQVLSPLILSPFALSPFILNPAAVTALVLSPFVLSPSIVSPLYITGIILSPYALSPSVESKGAMITVFASPNWLS